ncbi:MAG: hypothetical protein LBU65_09825 [Planctomycetaceae bacterium]|nr:hypothetical protein [Planctomycetaceae bacterium]
MFRPQGVAGFWPQDEYLADGGDDRSKVRVDSDWNVRGLESEDTVAHFDTVDGHTLVTSSNRIHIYAPRFGSVRKVQGSVLSGQRTFVSGTEGQLSPVTGRANVPVGFTEQETITQQTRSRVAAGGTAMHKTTSGMQRDEGLGSYSGADILMVYNNLMTSNKISDAQIVYLASASASARAWQGSEGLKVRINQLATMSMSEQKNAAEIFVVTDGEKKSQLKLIKVASKKSAQPGEKVEFIIRYENIGNAPIGNVTILDNLTTRLELIPNTVQSSLKAGFVVEPNQAGSSTLRFEITAPLLPNQFGVVKFECVVR